MSETVHPILDTRPSPSPRPWPLPSDMPLTTRVTTFPTPTRRVVSDAACLKLQRKHERTLTSRPSPSPDPDPYLALT